MGIGSREFLSLFPPFFGRTTQVEQYAPGLYGLVQPLALTEGGGFDVRLRMTVAKLRDGSLLVGGRWASARAADAWSAYCLMSGV